ncbi:hypothetical protein JCM16418A_07280 [Paenibacillus pini]|uniref:Uncharacterized protein n=1 Tax=Paenibacillus pini JCM 16418 TaxID=1236976 RepID=W7YVY2_9BACL|nr:hypothetical protein JCM16418_493 [Paenibacillus pini JCM 16418]
MKDILKDDPIDFLISSPYQRAILTIGNLASELNKDIILEEDLKERKLSGVEFVVASVKSVIRLWD